MTKRSLVPFLTHISDLEDFFKDFSTDFSNADAFKNNGVSIYEDEKHLFVEANMPGIDSEHIHITFEKGFLWIQGEKKEEKDEEEDKIKYHTKAASSFSYRVLLPNKVDENATIEAICEKGVLRVTFSKSKASMPKKIVVKQK